MAPSSWVERRQPRSSGSPPYPAVCCGCPGPRSRRASPNACRHFPIGIPFRPMADPAETAARGRPTFGRLRTHCGQLGQPAPVASPSRDRDVASRRRWRCSPRHAAPTGVLRGQVVDHLRCVRSRQVPESLCVLRSAAGWMLTRDDGGCEAVDVFVVSAVWALTNQGRSKRGPRTRSWPRVGDAGKLPLTDRSDAAAVGPMIVCGWVISSEAAGLVVEIREVHEAARRRRP